VRRWWWKRPKLISLRAAGETSDPLPDGRDGTGEYRLLYKYLRDRHANRLVLTFAEIEDLLGFSLPAPARLQRQWWGSEDESANPTSQSESWTRASRTATVNLSAQTVLFERLAPAHLL
jgi:hypothetical protein